MNNHSHSIYMDHSATTPVRAEVVDAMEPWWREQYGNPSSIHRLGRKANVALNQARRTLASLINAKPSEIIFTGSGTESDNAAIRGIALARRAQLGANHIITSAIEHHAVLHTVDDLTTHFGFTQSILEVDSEGIVELDALDNLLERNTDIALVSIMHANNEIGSIQPIAEIGQRCRQLGIPFHVDAVQTAGKLPLDVDSLAVDALSISGHKLYGPKGVGLLYLRNGTPFQPMITGGSHENGLRAGTENVPLIVGLAKALELAEENRQEEQARLKLLRDRLISQILETVPGSRLTGSWENRLPNLASFVIHGVEAEGILIGLDLAGIAASSGSACTSGSQRPSHVLSAIGVSAADATGGLRLSIGHETTPACIDYTSEKLAEIVTQIRGHSPPAL